MPINLSFIPFSMQKRPQETSCLRLATHSQWTKLHVATLFSVLFTWNRLYIVTRTHTRSLAHCAVALQFCAHKRAILFLDLFPDDVFMFLFTCRCSMLFLWLRFFFVSLILFGSSLDFTCTRQRPQYSNNENINSSSSAWRANILNFHWRMYEARCAVRQRYKSAESMCRLYEKGLVLIKTWAHEVYVQ